MSEFELIIAIVAVGGGIALTGFIFHGIFSLIRMGIESRSRNKAEASGEVVSVKEFREFKNRMEKRVQTLEAVIASEDFIAGGADENLLNGLDLDEDFIDQELSQKGALRNQLRSR
jgi:hypothetical protein